LNGLFDQHSTETQLINDLDKLKQKLERIQIKIAYNKLTQEELAALLTKLQKIRSKIFWFQ